MTLPFPYIRLIKHDCVFCLRRLDHQHKEKEKFLENVMCL